MPSPNPLAICAEKPRHRETVTEATGEQCRESIPYISHDDEVMATDAGKVRCDSGLVGRYINETKVVIHRSACDRNTCHSVETYARRSCTDPEILEAIEVQDTGSPIGVLPLPTALRRIELNLR